MVKASILSGESAFFQEKEQRSGGFTAGTCKGCRSRNRVRGRNRAKGSIVSSVTARNLNGTIQTEVLE